MGAPLRVGVIGCGTIATAVHLRVLRRLPGVRVTALADPAPEALARAGWLAPGAVLLSGHDALLARDDIDAVVVAAATGCHAPIAVATLNSGRHLYLEKPLATSIEDGRMVADVAHAAGVVSAIGFNWRFQPLIARAKQILDEGVLGDVRAVNTVFGEAATVPGWKARRIDGGGVLLDLGSHHFDLMRWLLGAEMARVEATLESRRSEHDVAQVRVFASGGPVMSSSFSLGVDSAHAIELVGERGVMRVDRAARTLTLHGVRARTITRASMVWRARSMVRPQSEPSWANILGAFVSKIRGANVELPTIDDGLRSLEMVVAAERAAGVR